MVKYFQGNFLKLIVYAKKKRCLIASLNVDFHNLVLSN